MESEVIEETVENPPKKKSKKIILFLLIIVLMVLSISAYFLFFNSKTLIVSSSHMGEGNTSLIFLTMLGHTSIESIEKWRVISKAGTESQLTFWTLDSKDKKTELGWIPPDNNCIGWGDKFLYDGDGNQILDDKSKAISLKCETAKCGGQNCYHISLTTAQAINIDRYVKLGSNSIVTEYQNQSRIEYITNWGAEVNVTLYENQSGDYSLNVDEIWINHNNDSEKFGANHSSMNSTEVRSFLYRVQSTSNIIKNGYRPYIYTTNYRGIPRRAIQERHMFDFSDICSRNFTNGLTSDCSFSYYNIYNNLTNSTTYYLNVTFNSDLFIDPSITVSTFSTSESIDVNVTQENNFTHLEVSNASTNSYNDLRVYISFDDNVSSTIVYDYSNNGHDGTINGVHSIVDSPYGKGINFFNVDGDFVDLGDSTDFDSGASGSTFMIWADPVLVDPTADDFLVDRTSGGEGYSLHHDSFSSGSWRCTFDAASITVVNSNSAPSGNWQHIVCLRNSSGIFMYLDGVMQTDTGAFSGTINPTASLTIGRSTDNFNGSLDEFMYFRDDLPEADILAIYNNQSVRFKTDGIQELKQFNITSGNNTVNVTTNDFEELLGSSLQLRLGEWDITQGYNDSFDGESEGYILDDGLVGYWHFDNLSSRGENQSLVLDYSNYSNNGTVIGDIDDADSGITTTNSIFENAMMFDGDGDYVDVGTDDSLNLSLTMTFSAWIYPTSSVNGPILLTNATSSAWGPAMWILDTEKIIFGSDPGTDNFLISDTALSFNQWHHVVGKIDNGNNCEIYINGVNESTTTGSCSGELLVDSTGSTFIGRRTINFFNGTIDEVMIFNRSLTSDEITELYVKGRANWDYTPYKDVDTTNKTYVINSLTTNLLPEYKFNAINSTNPFYSPLLKAGMTFTFGHVTPPNITFTSGTESDFATVSQSNVYMNVTTEHGSNVQNLSYNLYNSTFNKTGLVGYWAFDFNNTQQFDISGNENTGTANGDFFVNDSGMLNGGGHFRGLNSGDYVLADDNGDNFGKTVCRDGCSFSAWAIKRDGSGSAAIIGRSDATNNDIFFDLFVEASEDTNFRISPDGTVGSICNVDYTAGDININQWYHYVGVYDNSTGTGNVSVYRDGVHLKSLTCGFAGINTTNWTDDEDVFIGTNDETSIAIEWNGSIDEVMVFNRSLSADEINALFNRRAVNRTIFGTNITEINMTGLANDDYHYFADIWDNLDQYDSTEIRNINVTGAVGDNAPVVTLSMPDDDNSTQQGQVVFECNATDDFQLLNVSLYVWNKTSLALETINSTDWNGTTNSTQLSYEFTEDDDFIWNCEVFDNESQQAWGSANFTININATEDAVFPDVNIVFPTNYTNTTNTGININFSASDDVALSTCWFSNDTFTKNITTSCGGNLTNITWIEGGHNVTVWVNDTSDNVNKSSVTFTVDTIAPEINITSPINDSNTTDTGIDIDYTFTEVNPDTCWYSNDTFTENITISCGTNITTVVWIEGNHNVTIWINDSVDQINKSAVTFNIDTIPPDVNITFPTNFTNTTNTGININFTAGADATECWFSNDTFTKNISIGCAVNITNVTWIEGGHNVTIWTNDSLNNLNKSSVTFTIDTIPPTIEVPENISVVWDTNIVSIFNATDEGSGVNGTTWAVDDSSNFTINSTGGLTNSSRLVVGTYLLNVSVNDTLQNVASIPYRVDINPINTSLDNIRIKVEEFIFDSANYIAISNVSFNLTQIEHLTIKGVGQLRLAGGGGSANVDMKLTLNNLVLFDKTIRTVSGVNDRGVFNIPINGTEGLVGENNLTVEIKEDGVSSMNISNLEISIDHNMTDDLGNVEHSDFQFDGTSASATDVNIANFTFEKTNANSSTVLDVIHTFGKTGATDSSPECYLRNNVTNEATPTYHRYLSGPTDTGSSGINFISQVKTIDVETWQLFCQSSDADTILNNVTVYTFEITNNNQNVIISFQNQTERTGLTGNDNLLLTQNHTVGSGDNVQLIATIITQSTSGAQQGANSPTFTLNSSTLSEGNCRSSYARSLSGNSDIGTAKIYLICNGTSAGENHVFNVYASIIGGETLNILNASLSGYDANLVNTSQGALAPAVVIIVPENGTVTSGITEINATVTDISNLGWASNVTLLNPDATFNQTIFDDLGLNNNITNTTFNTSLVADGNYTIDWTVTGSAGSNFDRVNFSINNLGETSLDLEVLNPTNLTETFNSTQNSFFNVTVRVTCRGGNCGSVNVSLDPEVILQEANLENLEDTHTESDDPNDNFGSANNMEIQNDTNNAFNRFGYIKFNISSILSKESIVECSLNLFMQSESLDASESVNISLFHVFNQSWVEESLTHNTRPTGGQINITFEDKITLSNGDPIGWKVLNCSNSLREDFSESKTNISFALLPKEAVVTTTPDQIRFTTKEGANSSNRPFLNITFTESSKGLISTTIGATPFYTNETNPRTVSLNQDESIDVVFWVNATGDVDSNHTFFAFANQTSDLSVSNQSADWNVTIQGVVADNINPNINIQFPTNDTNSSNTGLNINFTASDDIALSTCWFSNDTFTKNITINCAVNITNVTWIEGNHNITIWANDTNNNINKSSTTFNIDTIQPDINIQFPTNYTNTTNTGININFTAGTDAINCFFSNDTFTLNTTINCFLNITNITWIEGGHNITIWANDSAGNQNKSSVNFIVDITPPTFDNLANQTLEDNESLSYDIDATDVGLLIGGFSINDTHGGLFIIDVSTGILTNDSSLIDQVDIYHINVTVNDSVGNLESGIFFVNVTNSTVAVPDSVPPNINIDSPTNYTNTTNTGININFTASDDVALDTCFFSNDTFTQNITINCAINITNITWIEGGHNVTIWANDSSGNINKSSVTFTIDTIFPQINITSPINNSNSSDTGLDVEYTFTEVNPQNCFFSNDSFTKNITIGCGNNLTNITWIEGSHEVAIWINDSAGNLNKTSVNFTIDTLVPDINIQFPTNYTNTTDTGLNINFTAGDDATTCFFSNDTFTKNITINCGINITNVTWIEGGHNVTIWANDSSGNENKSSVNFIVDITAPTFDNLANQTLEDNESLSYDIDATDVGLLVESFVINDTFGGLFEMDIATGVLTNASSLIDQVDIYHFNVTVNDTVGNQDSGIFFVNVTNSSIVVPDTTPPTFDNLRNFTHTVNTSFSQSITASDDTAVDTYTLNDTSIFVVNSATGLITNTTGLPSITIHHLNLSVNDTSNNLLSGVFFINITSAPVEVITGLSIDDMILGYNVEFFDTDNFDLEMGYNHEF